jgi:hypothetical protein
MPEEQITFEMVEKIADCFRYAEVPEGLVFVITKKHAKALCEELGMEYDPNKTRYQKGDSVVIVDQNSPVSFSELGTHA